MTMGSFSAVYSPPALTRDVTNLAPSFSSNQIGVGFAVRMPLRTMSDQRFSATAILLCCDGFKVVRPNTQTCTAKVIPLKTIGRFAYKKMVSKCRGAEPEKAITISRSVSRPQPTSVGFGDLFPEAFFSGSTWVYSRWHRMILSVSMRRAVSAAPPSTYFTTGGMLRW